MINKYLVKLLPYVPKYIVRKVANKYLAGVTLSDALRTVKSLNTKGAMATIDVLGEFTKTKEDALRERAQCADVLEEIFRYKLNANLSLKLTSIGMDIDDEFCFQNLKFLVEKARCVNLFVRIDMENSPYTSKTLEMYKRLRAEGLDNVGVVIQAYLKRSEADIKELLPLKPSIRLCKGIYIESETIAYKGYEEVRDNYKKLAKLALDGGAYIGFATHDDELINFALKELRDRHLEKDKYEFQMLLGVKEERRAQIIEHGHRLRVYTPYGEDWYGYSVRRLKENPQIAGYVMKAMFTGS